MTPFLGDKEINPGKPQIPRRDIKLPPVTMHSHGMNFFGGVFPSPKVEGEGAV